MLKFLMIIFIVFCNDSVLYSGTIDPNTPDHRYVEYAKEFHYVGKLCGSYKDGKKFCASAVAIDNHHILTAAHVVQNSEICIVSIKDKDFFIKEFTINKDFDEKTFGLADIAIGYSEKSFDLDFYPELYDKEDEVGSVCSIAGYGFTGNFIRGSKFHDNKKRAGSNMIDNVYKDLLICSPSKNNEENKTSLEFLIASGDSGGGLFIGNKLAGINSCVISSDGNPNSSYGDESGHTRISIYKQWIMDNKKK